MAGDTSESKGEAATPRRLRDARRRGQVARSAELSGALSLLCTLLCVIGMAPWAAHRLAGFDRAVQRAATVVDLAAVQAMATEGIWLMLQLSLIPLGVAACMYLATLWLQTGPVFSLDPVTPQLDRIDPVAGARRVFSMRSLVTCALMAVKAGILGVAVVLVCRDVLGDAVRVVGADAGAALAVADKALMDLLLWCGGLFALLGLADLAYQRWQFSRDMRMSLSEVRREHRDDQGDDRLRSQRRHFAQDAAPRDQLDHLPSASLAIADDSGRVVVLLYRPKDHPLPFDLVHGQADFGADILAGLARHRVPTVIDGALLARLFPAVRIGQPVPAHLFDALRHHLRSTAPEPPWT